MSKRAVIASALFATVGQLALVAVDSDSCRIDVRPDGIVQGRLLREDANGVDVEMQVDGKPLVRSWRWDQIRSLDTDASGSVREQRIRTGTVLWRAISRFARGDMDGARAMFLAARPMIESEATSLALIVDAGIAATAQAAPSEWDESLIAAMRTAAHTVEQLQALADALNSSDLDLPSGLVLDVPPAWVDGNAAEHAMKRLSRCADEARVAGDPMAAQLLDYAARIAAADAGIPAAPQSSALARPQGKVGIKLLAAWADGVSADAGARKRGRESLKTIIRNSSGQLRAWAIFAEGRSLAMENDPALVRLGAGRMMLIPAMYAPESQQLARCAIAQAAIALARIHDDESASILRGMKRPDSMDKLESRTKQQGDGP